MDSLLDFIKIAIYVYGQVAIISYGIPVATTYLSS